MARFPSFLLAYATGSSYLSESESIRHAARRFLRGRFLCRPDMTEDQAQGALLNFIYSLESLILGGEDEAVSYKIRSRTAWMASVDDQERMKVLKFVKFAYDARSGIVHRDRKKKKKNGPQIDLPALIEICRRAIGAAILLGLRMDDEFVRTLLISRMNQDAVLRAARTIRSLTNSA